MTLNGKNKQDYIGRLIKIIALSQSQIGTKVIHMNFWEQKKDFALLLLQTDAI
jgi:hypothetical protein